MFAYVNSLFRNLLQKQWKEQDLDQEIRSHLQLLVDEKINGMNFQDAAREARIELGGIEQVKEQVRSVRAGAWLESLWQDVRFGVRMLRKSPGFTMVAVMTLALGIGVNSAVFTMTKAAFFKGFPLVEGNDRILYMRSANTNYGQESYVSYPDFEYWRAQAKSFEGMGACIPSRISLSDQSGFPEDYGGTKVTANTFKLIGLRPIIGRDFAPPDDTPGAAPVAILTYGLWERRYGKDRAIIGQTVRINGVQTEVIGVMPRGLAFPFGEDLWIPLVPDENLRKAHNYGFVFGRIADGANIESVRAEMATIGTQLASAYPLTNQGVVPTVQDFGQYWIGPRMTMIYASMLGAVAFVLLIACANLSNLMLAHAIGRAREISLRIALGAGRWRIMRQLLIESLMLSGLGGFFGWWISKWGVRAYTLAAFPEAKAQAWQDFTMDYRVLAYLIAISVGTGLLFGLAPASRLLNLDVNSTLKDGGRGAIGGGRTRRLSSLLIIGEMALAIVLLAGAGLMIRSFLNVYTAANTGVRAPNNILTMWLNASAAKYPTAMQQISFYERLETRVRALPGVESVAIAYTYPTGRPFTLPYELADAPTNDDRRHPMLSALVISPSYFRTLGAEVLSGREFNDADGGSGVPVLIVNQRFASEHWPGENPLGKRVRLFDGKMPSHGGQQTAWMTVIGVVSNIVQEPTRQEFDPLVYMPYRQQPTTVGMVDQLAGSMYVIARTRVPPGSLANAFQREAEAIDANRSSKVWTLTQIFQQENQSVGSSEVPFLIFAACALLLASIGLYAVSAYSVSQRTQEIGIRMAVGATKSDVCKLVFVQGMIPVSIGLTIGLAASFAVDRILRAQLVRVSPSDPITLAAASTVLILSATLGCLIPARRAMRVDPMVALRHE